VNLSCSCLHNQKNYLIIMFLELVFLSIVYWCFFIPNISSILVYAASTFFYITGFNFWMQKYKKNEHFSIDFTEHFIMNNSIVLLILITIKSFMKTELINIAISYIAIIIIFIAYYSYRIIKQNKEVTNIIKISPSFKLLTIVSIILLYLDFISLLYGKLTLQLIIYLPIFFILICSITLVFSKEISFKSIISFLLFANAFFISIFLLILNYQSNNYFTFLLIIHFILFASSICFFKLNSNFSDKKDIYCKNEFIYLLFFNTVLLFISLNNILSFEIAKGFTIYIFIVIISFIIYLAYHNYKILINKINTETNTGN